MVSRHDPAKVLPRVSDLLDNSDEMGLRAVEELQRGVGMYTAELPTKQPVAQGLRSVLGETDEQQTLCLLLS